MEEITKDQKKEENEARIEKRKEKISKWLKNPYNLALLIILIIFFIVKLYFFFLTKNQPIWWDEAEYVGNAKKWAFGTPYNLNIQRQPLFPILIGILLKLGMGIAATKFFLAVLPAFLTAVFLFYFAKELYGEKIALISAFLMLICWNFSFWSYRFSTDVLGLFFGILCLYFFVLAEKRNSTKFYIFSGLAFSFGFLSRIPNIFMAVVLLPYLLLKGKRLFDKKIFFFIIAVLIPIIPYLVYNFVLTGDPIAFAQTYFGFKAAAEKVSRPVAWGVFKLIPLYFGWKPFFYIFILGLFSFYSFFLSLDLLFKNDKNARYDFLLLLILLIPLLIVAFGERNYEERWGYLSIPAIFIIFSRGIMLIEKAFKKYSGSMLALLKIAVIIFLLIGAYINLKTLNTTLISKKDSFSQVRDAGIWLKENSEKQDVVFSNSPPQINAYSERLTYWIDSNQSVFVQNLSETKAKYIVLTTFEQIHPWINEWLQNNTKIKPLQPFLMDYQGQKVPAAIVYEVSQ